MEFFAQTLLGACTYLQGNNMTAVIIQLNRQNMTGIIKSM